MSTTTSRVLRASAAVCVAALVAAAVHPASEQAEAGTEPPNVVLIMTDDQTLESMRAMPLVQELLVDEGLSFEQFLAGYPLCCPSRASFLTGQYAQNNGVFGNAPNHGAYGGQGAFIETEDGEVGAEATALPVALQDAGYRTMHVGKYLNGYGVPPQSQPTDVPPGWDDWYALTGNAGVRYEDFTVNDDGDIVEPPGYQTDVLTDEAVTLIDEAASGDPFFLSVGYFAPHFVKDFSGNTVIPADRHEDLFEDEPLPDIPSFNEGNVDDKPTFIAEHHDALTLGDQNAMTEYYGHELEAIQAVDEGVQAIVDELEAQNVLENTVIVFTSDNGLFHGEHRIQYGKQLPYSEALNVPLIIRGPGVPEGEITQQLAANIDVAPTISAITGAPLLRTPDGVDLSPVIADPGSDIERTVLLSSYRSSPVGSVDRESRPPYVGIRSGDLQYVEYSTDEGRQAELYDLALDPFQLANRIADDSYAAEIDDLARRLQELRFCAGTTCPTPQRGFRDVPPTSPFHDEILWTSEEGISEGFSGQLFRPTRPVSRQAMAAFLYRAAGSPPGPFPSAGFSDVPSSHPFEEEIDWLVDAGIAVGFSDGTFRPDQDVTRQAMAAYLHRSEGDDPGPFPNPGFSDVPASHPFRQDIAWLVDAGVAEGFSDGTFRPARAITRQAMAVFLMRVDAL